MNRWTILKGHVINRGGTRINTQFIIYNKYGIMDSQLTLWLMICNAALSITSVLVVLIFHSFSGSSPLSYYLHKAMFGTKSIPNTLLEPQGERKGIYRELMCKKEVKQGSPKGARIIRTTYTEILDYLSMFKSKSYPESHQMETHHRSDSIP